jgi:hypothetical protein
MMIRAMMIASVIGFGFAMGAAQAETASVATLTQVGGKVMVNKGKGFVAAKSGMALAENDRLITLDASSASVVFADGCVNNVKANSVLSVSKAAGCKAPALAVNSSMPLRYAQGTSITTTDAGKLGTVETIGGISGKWLLIGGLITFVAAASSTDNNNNNPVSGQ